jgi:hypothetical protein
MPNLNSIPAMAIAIVATALLSIAGTSAVHQFVGWRMVIPAADPPPLHKLVADISNRLDGRITETLGTAIVCVEEIQALRKERTPSVRQPAPALKKAGG